MEPSHPDIAPLFERFLALPTGNLELALSEAADIVASALGADKVDAFLQERSCESLVALGRSHQPLSALQHQVGLDILPIANGGRVVEVFQTGRPFMSGELRSDPEELVGIRETLKVQSFIAVALDLGASGRGVLGVASQQAKRWDDRHLRFTEAVARWVGMIAHRAQLVETAEREAIERGRRAAADELVMAVAHDLRNYLTPLELRLLALGRRAQRDGRADDSQDAERALRSLARISDFVTDLLDVARIDHGLFAITRKPTDLTVLCKEVANSLSTGERQVEVRVFEDVTTSADVARLRQCLENLVANALKHGPAGSLVLLNLSCEKGADGERARIDVIDEGPGIPEHLLPHIFERFVSGQGARGAGLGLGLFLAKRIATTHGGDLTVDSQPGRGTRFVLTLPL